MKVIDLLNKISKGEEAPKKIKTVYNDYTYTIWEYTGIDYVNKDDDYFFEIHTRINKDDLNEEVEIIEEEKKIPEKLIPTSLKGIDNLDEKIEIAHIDIVDVIDTVNEIIDYLKSKGE